MRRFQWHLKVCTFPKKIKLNKFRCYFNYRATVSVFLVQIGKVSHYLHDSLQALPCRFRGLMTRGDQRERDRAKNLKKQQQEKKGTSLPDGMTVAQKKEL